RGANIKDSTGYAGRARLWKPSDAIRNASVKSLWKNPRSLMTSISPAQVRELRGAASRAAFARRLGVTPNTVYRWELPESAAEARRPRGAELQKLSQLTVGASISEQPLEAEVS